MNTLDKIYKIQEMYGDREPRNMADGGRIGFSNGKKVKQDWAKYYYKDKNPTRFTETQKAKIYKLTKEGKDVDFILEKLKKDPNFPKFKSQKNIDVSKQRLIGLINNNTSIPKKFKIIPTGQKGQNLTYQAYSDLKKKVANLYKKQNVKNVSEIAKELYPKDDIAISQRKVRTLLKDAGVREIAEPTQKLKGTGKNFQGTQKKTKFRRELSDSYIERKSRGNLADKIEFHHADSKNLNAKILTEPSKVAYLPKDINQELNTRDAYISKLYDQREALGPKPKNKEKLKTWKKEWDRINKVGNDFVANPKSKGLLNFNIIDDVSGKVLNKGLDESKMIMRTPDPNIIYGEDDYLGNKPFKKMTRIEKDKFLKIAKDNLLKTAKESKNIPVIQSKGIAKKLNVAGFKCKLADGLTCNDPRAYTQSIKENMAKVKQGDNAAVARVAKLGKAMNAFKGAAKFTGWGLLAELGFAAPLATIDYAKGANKDEIISNATYGLFGKSEEEQLKEKYADYGKAQELQNTYENLLEAENLAQTGAGYRTQAINKLKAEDLNKKLLEQSKAFNTILPPSMGFKGELDYNRFYDAQLLDKQRRDDFAKEKEIRSKEIGILQPSTGLEAVQFAGGGIAGLSGGDPEGAMTKSMNPDSQGLRSLYNNVRKL